MVNGYTRGTFSCRSLQLRVIGGSCIIPVPVSYVLRYVVDRSRKNALGGASVALFARELRINVRLMAKPRYYDNNPSNVSLLPNPLPQELTRFYGRLYAFSIYLDRYSTTAEDVAIKGDLPRTNINRLDYLFNSRHSQKSQSLA